MGRMGGRVFSKAGNLISIAIYSWFTHWKRVDFPVRYVNVYQRVFHGEIGEIMSMSSWDLITMFAGEPLNRLADDTSTKFSYWITFVVLSSKHRFHIITGWWF
jgi:hypothetical protein